MKHIIYIILFVLLIGIIYIISKSFISKSPTKHIQTGDSVDNIWYSDNDLKINESIELSDIHGYVLPHAGTKYTGNIISHTLQFKPTKFFDKIYIIYYPSHKKPNIDDEYYHEYYVPYSSLKYIVRYQWKIYGIMIVV